MMLPLNGHLAITLFPEITKMLHMKTPEKYILHNARFQGPTVLFLQIQVFQVVTVILTGKQLPRPRRNVILLS